MDGYDAEGYRDYRGVPRWERGAGRRTATWESPPRSKPPRRFKRSTFSAARSACCLSC